VLIDILVIQYNALQSAEESKYLLPTKTPIRGQGGKLPEELGLHQPSERKDVRGYGAINRAIVALYKPRYPLYFLTVH